MQQQRAHQQGVAARGGADSFAVLGAQGLHLRIAQPSGAMAAGHHAQGACIGTAIVEVHAHGEQRLQHLDGRLHIGLAFLQYARQAAARCGNRGVLVQRDQPVPPGRLVEQRALHRNRGSIEQALGDQHCLHLNRHVAALQLGKQVAAACRLAQPAVEGLRSVLQQIGGQQCRQKRMPLLFEQRSLPVGARHSRW